MGSDGDGRGDAEPFLGQEDGSKAVSEIAQGVAGGVLVLNAMKTRRMRCVQYRSVQALEFKVVGYVVLVLLG